MGYARFNLDDGFGDRGYAVEDRCPHAEPNGKRCEQKIDRGLAFLCYSCQRYFCSVHLAIAYDKNDAEVEFDSYAGASSQCCVECAKKVAKEPGDADGLA